VKKGERILVTGRLRIREWENAGKAGTNIEIEAESLGHDLLWGTANFSRGTGTAPADSAAVSAEAATAFPTEADLAATSADAATPF
jgi:single-strand DNA-binding protein